MAKLITDSNDPRLGHGIDESPVPQSEAYLVLSAEERAKGFVRPYRDAYLHVGEKPKHPLRELTDDEKSRYGESGYVKFEAYPVSESPVTGRFWTQEQLDKPECNAVTTMSRELAETYARQPDFYGATYCVGCKKHRPVAEFVWALDGERVGS